MNRSSEPIETDGRSVMLRHPDGTVRDWKTINPMAFGPNYPDEASQREFLERLASFKMPKSNPAYGNEPGNVLHRCYS